jgi:hypothetical protein
MVAAQAVAVVFQFATVRDGSGWGSKGGKRWRWYKCVHNQKEEIKMNLKKNYRKSNIVKAPFTGSLPGWIGAFRKKSTPGTLALKMPGVWLIVN